MSADEILSVVAFVVSLLTLAGTICLSRRR